MPMNTQAGRAAEDYRRQRMIDDNNARREQSAMIQTRQRQTEAAGRRPPQSDPGLADARESLSGTPQVPLNVPPAPLDYGSAASGPVRPGTAIETAPGRSYMSRPGDRYMPSAPPAPQAPMMGADPAAAQRAYLSSPGSKNEYASRAREAAGREAYLHYNAPPQGKYVGGGVTSPPMPPAPDQQRYNELQSGRDAGLSREGYLAREQGLAMGADRARQPGLANERFQQETAAAGTRLGMEGQRLGMEQERLKSDTDFRNAMLKLQEKRDPRLPQVMEMYSKLPPDATPEMRAMFMNLVAMMFEGGGGGGVPPMPGNAGNTPPMPAGAPKLKTERRFNPDTESFENRPLPPGPQSYDRPLTVEERMNPNLNPDAEKLKKIYKDDEKRRRRDEESGYGGPHDYMGGF